MAEIICIIGNKGGTGKTTLSHLLCHGLCLLGRRAACVMTDEDREPVLPDGRRYVVADARSPHARDKVVSRLRELRGWIGVIDGGANRTDLDIALYQMSDIVLLPFRDSPEDHRAVLRDLDLFPKARALPSQWPTNRWQLEAANRMIGELPEDFRARVLAPIQVMSATKTLLQTRVRNEPTAALNRLAREFAQSVLNLFEEEAASVASVLAQARAEADADELEGRA